MFYTEAKPDWGIIRESRGFIERWFWTKADAIAFIVADYHGTVTQVDEENQYVHYTLE